MSFWEIKGYKKTRLAIILKKLRAKQVNGEVFDRFFKKLYKKKKEKVSANKKELTIKISAIFISWITKKLTHKKSNPIKRKKHKIKTKYLLIICFLKL